MQRAERIYAVAMGTLAVVAWVTVVWFVLVVAFAGCGGVALDEPDPAGETGWCCGEQCDYTGAEADARLLETGSCTCDGVVRPEPGTVMGDCLVTP